MNMYETKALWNKVDQRHGFTLIEMMVVMSILMTMAMMVENMDKTGRSLGSPGIDELRWTRPVYPGDVLSVRMEVLELRPSKSKPGIGFVTSRTTVSNQDATRVMEFISTGIFPRKES